MSNDTVFKTSALIPVPAHLLADAQEAQALMGQAFRTAMRRHVAPWEFADRNPMPAFTLFPHSARLAAALTEARARLVAAFDVLRTAYRTTKRTGDSVIGKANPRLDPHKARNGSFDMGELIAYQAINSGAWEEFTELVSTVRDECLPISGPLDEDWLQRVARDVVFFICTDADMRDLMKAVMAVVSTDET